MNRPAFKCVTAIVLMLGLALAGFAAKAPDDPKDIIRFLDSLWGKSTGEFARAAKLKPDEHQLTSSPADPTRKVINVSEAVRAKWAPKSIASALRSFEFDPKLGLAEASGPLTGTAADFDALMKEINSRYGQYATRSSALETNIYGWVFPKCTLSISTKEGAATFVRIQANP